MTFLKKEKFERLANVHDAPCVSLYLSTHSSGHEVSEDVDKVNLKNQIKEVAVKLESYGLHDEEIKSYLSPVYNLLNEDTFWRHQSDGLAVFLYGDKLERLTLPSSFREFSYVADHLYLKPLVPLLNNFERFFILALSLGEVRFYEGSSQSIVEVEMEGLVPHSLVEALTAGDDYEHQSIRFRSGQGKQGKTLYHGHGPGTIADKKDDILKYFREIDEGMMRMLHAEEAPLLLVCADYLAPIYREANAYSNLFDIHISGNHEKTTLLSLHTLARDLLQDYFEKDKRNRYEEFHKNVHKRLASYQEKEVIPAAIIGQVDTLYVLKNQNLWGLYDSEKHKIILHKQKRVENSCLLNKAVVETLKNKGKVYLMEEEEMPEKNTLINATFRYKV